MKKIFSFVGALFLGSAAFAQGSKTDSANKTISRKVLADDVKGLPASTDAANKSGGIKGAVMEKHRTVVTEKLGGDHIKGGAVQKGKLENPFEKQMPPAIKMNAADSAAAQQKTGQMKMPTQKN